jgi:DNA-binding response OmpR family regulator
VWLPASIFAPRADHGPADESPDHQARSMRVLVVDDNQDAADMMTTMLGQWGYDARPATTGHDAVRSAGAFKPEIVLLDLGLPDIDGYEVARQLRELDSAATLRIFAVTGRGLDEDRRRSKASGLDDHLVKPIDPDALRRLLAQLSA